MHLSISECKLDPGAGASVFHNVGPFIVVVIGAHNVNDVVAKGNAPAALVLHPILKALKFEGLEAAGSGSLAEPSGVDAVGDFLRLDLVFDAENSHLQFSHPVAGFAFGDRRDKIGEAVGVVKGRRHFENSVKSLIS